MSVWLPNWLSDLTSLLVITDLGPLLPYRAGEVIKGNKFPYSVWSLVLPVAFLVLLVITMR